MTEIKFTSVEDEELIEQVARNPPLFNIQVESYKDGNIRDNIWRDIAEKLKRNDGDCKRRWKYIRDSYNRFKRKRKLSARSAPPPKNSKWEFFEKLHFLDLVLADGRTDSAAGPAANERPEYRCKDECPPQSPGPPSPSAAHQDEFLDRLRERVERRQVYLRHLVCGTSGDSDDDVASFGNHVKSVLRKLRPRLKIKAKNEIFNVLIKYEMFQLDVPEEILVSSNPSTPDPN